MIGNREVKKVDAQDEILYGTHTLPKEFWTSKKEPLLKNPEYRKRRAEKKVRHEKNKTERASKNAGHK